MKTGRRILFEHAISEHTIDINLTDVSSTQKFDGDPDYSYPPKMLTLCTKYRYGEIYPGKPMLVITCHRGEILAEILYTTKQRESNQQLRCTV